MKFGLKDETYKKILKIAKDNNEYKFKIFGSRARGDYKENSDIDIAVFENLNKEDEYKIRNEIDLLDIIYKIDLVFIDKKTKAELVKEIRKEGVDLI